MAKNEESLRKVGQCMFGVFADDETEEKEVNTQVGTKLRVQ